MSFLGLSGFVNYTDLLATYSMREGGHVKKKSDFASYKLVLLGKDNRNRFETDFTCWDVQNIVLILV
jgi:hypothetical protein